MNGLIKKYIVEPLSDRVAEKVISYWKTEAMGEMAWEVFSTLGLQELEEIVVQAKKNKKLKGHNDYFNLGEIYSKRIKTITIKRLEEVLNKLSKV